MSRCPRCSTRLPIATVARLAGLPKETAPCRSCGAEIRAARIWPMFTIALPVLVAVLVLGSERASELGVAAQIAIIVGISLAAHILTGRFARVALVEPPLSHERQPCRRVMRILYPFIALLVLPTIVAAQERSSEPSEEMAYAVPDELIGFGAHLRNRGDSVFWFEVVMEMTAPPSSRFTYNRTLDSIPTRYRSLAPETVAIADTAVIPIAPGVAALAIEYPTCRDTIRLVVTRSATGLVVDLDTMSIVDRRCPDCYRSDVRDTVGGSFRRALASRITKGLVVNDVYRMIGRGGWYGWSERFEGAVRWVLDRNESLYMTDVDGIVERVWIGPSE